MKWFLLILLFLPGLLFAQTVLEGQASWYGPGFHGRLTANGERYNMHDLTAAHKSLPFGTELRVTLIETGASVVVRVNDRGPFVDDRIIDLSREAARRIGLLEMGVGPVKILILSAPPTAVAHSDKVYIQVGSYKEESSAIRQKKEGGDLGLEVQIYYSDPFFRVVLPVVREDQAKTVEFLETNTNWSYLVRQLPPEGKILSLE